jgi:hypothetical protein
VSLSSPQKCTFAMLVCTWQYGRRHAAMSVWLCLSGYVTADQFAELRHGIRSWGPSNSKGRSAR